MNDLYIFMGNHPWLTLLLVLCLLGLARGLCYFFFISWNRFMRMIMVRKHGWPPAHLDADGDWRPAPKSDDSDDTLP